MPEFLQLDEPVIIATKGLPCTGKSEIGRVIAQWAKCPVLYIDYFLDAFSLEKGYTSSESLPSPDEADLLHRLSFDALCNAASDTLQWGSASASYHSKSVVIEKVMDDYDADDWALHLDDLLSNGDGQLPRLTRLVVDPFDDLYLVPHAGVNYITEESINHLLGTAEKVARSMREERLSGPRSRGSCGHKYLCYSCKLGGCRCVLKYWEELKADVDDEGNPYYCGVCEERVISGQPAYACQLCTLTLHKSCAEKTTDIIVDFTNIQGFEDINGLLKSYPKNLPRQALISTEIRGEGDGQYSCKSCLERGRGFSPGCLGCDFQTHLKRQVLPTMINHDCHEHLMSISFNRGYKCKACGTSRYLGFGASYDCFICDADYDIECLSLAREPEHEHGGHQHTLKLMYSRDEMDKEEAYWCEICYKDIDPQNWFYSYQDCPSFEAHPNCVRHSRSNN